MMVNLELEELFGCTREGVHSDRVTRAMRRAMRAGYRAPEEIEGIAQVFDHKGTLNVVVKKHQKMNRGFLLALVAAWNEEGESQLELRMESASDERGSDFIDQMDLFEIVEAAGRADILEET